MRNVTTADGLTLAYDDQGAGVPLLCLAGLTRNMDDFEPVLETFGDRARIIRLDSRGRGASDFAEDVMTYSVVQEAADALALVDHLGLDKVAILGGRAAERYRAGYRRGRVALHHDLSG